MQLVCTLQRSRTLLNLPKHLQLVRSPWKCRPGRTLSYALPRLIRLQFLVGIQVFVKFKLALETTGGTLLAQLCYFRDLILFAAYSLLLLLSLHLLRVLLEFPIFPPAIHQTLTANQATALLSTTKRSECQAISDLNVPMFPQTFQTQTNILMPGNQTSTLRPSYSKSEQAHRLTVRQ